jgi:hypothetical protein
MDTLTDLQVSIDVSASPSEAFDKVCQVREWWTKDIEGETSGLGAEFRVTFGTTFVDFRISNFVPDETVSWFVTNSELPWLKDKTEWTGTTVQIDVIPTDAGSKITLTHHGLHPNVECFEGCKEGWEFFVVKSLPRLIATGVGLPGVPNSERETYE